MTPMGRPKLDDPISIKLSIRLDRKTNESLEKYCEEHSITKGEAIRRGIHVLLMGK